MASPFWIPTETSGRLAILARPRGGDWLPDEVAVWKRAGIWQGIGRSGLLAIGILSVLGVSTADAIRKVSLARGVPVPETTEQLEWIPRFKIPALTEAGSR